MSFKKCKVVMLPTNEKASIWLDNFGSGLYNRPTNATGVIYQHLYILSDEEIKRGDWFVGFADGSIKPFVKQADESTVEINNWQLNKKGYSSNKKIIATTDRFLKVFIHTTIAIDMDDCYESLPQPSQSFIEHFVAEYNKGNVITKVLVEYDLSDYDIFCDRWELKINSDNTINISMPKDSWSREEVIELLKKSKSDFPLHRGVQLLDLEFNKWIEENL